MSEDVAEADDRNEFGFPPIAVTARERSFQTTNVDQSVNKALPWIAFSWFLSGGAVLGLLILSILIPAVIDARVSKETAEIRAAVAVAKTDAKLASTNPEKMWAQLDARGVLSKENH